MAGPTFELRYSADRAPSLDRLATLAHEQAQAVQRSGDELHLVGYRHREVTRGRSAGSIFLGVSFSPFDSDGQRQAFLTALGWVPEHCVTAYAMANGEADREELGDIASRIVNACGGHILVTDERDLPSSRVAAFAGQRASAVTSAVQAMSDGYRQAEHLVTYHDVDALLGCDVSRWWLCDARKSIAMWSTWLRS